MTNARRALLAATLAGAVGLAVTPSTAQAAKPGDGTGPTIGILLFPGFALLDAAGPVEILARIPEVNIAMIGEKRGLVRTDTGDAAMNADHSVDEIADLDVLLVPGGTGHSEVSGSVVDWIRRIHRDTVYTTSVCTGAMLLGQAGLLDGKRATTYWSAAPALEEFGASYVAERYVRDGKTITAAGVSAGQDLAFYLTSLLTDERTAQALELGVEYDPQPPFGTGNPQDADEELKEFALRLMNDSVA